MNKWPFCFLLLGCLGMLHGMERCSDEWVRVSRPVPMSGPQRAFSASSPITVQCSPATQLSVKIDRSPSAVLPAVQLAVALKKQDVSLTEERVATVVRKGTIKMFGEHILQQVSQAEQKYPNRSLVIDFGDTLVRLFARLQKSPSDYKAWKKRLEKLMQKVAERYNVSGIRVRYCYLTDLPVVAALIKPLINLKKLETCSVCSAFPEESPTNEPVARKNSAIPHCLLQ